MLMVLYFGMAINAQSATLHKVVLASLVDIPDNVSAFYRLQESEFAVSQQKLHANMTCDALNAADLVVAYQDASKQFILSHCAKYDPARIITIFKDCSLAVSHIEGALCANGRIVDNVAFAKQHFAKVAVLSSYPPAQLVAPGVDNIFYVQNKRDAVATLQRLAKSYNAVVIDGNAEFYSASTLGLLARVGFSNLIALVGGAHSSWVEMGVSSGVFIPDEVLLQNSLFFIRAHLKNDQVHVINPRAFRYYSAQPSAVEP